MQKGFVIAIDGPAASGKGTLARRLAAHFELPYLDTGKLYRAVALAVLESEKSPEDKQAAIEAARTLAIGAVRDPRLTEERVGKAASVIASIPEVRAALLDFQRNFAAQPEGAVLDGRDIGTVICPDALAKLFIEADVRVRAERRYNELQAKGSLVRYEDVLKDMEERDALDKARASAPLVAAEDALCVDTSQMDAEQVFSYAVDHIKSQIGSNIES